MSPRKAASQKATPQDGESAVRGLGDLGLTLGESRAYVALLEGGTGTAAEVAANASIARPKVYEALRLLEEKGFVTSSIEGSITRYQPMPPGFAIEAWLRRREEDRKSEAEHEGDLAQSLTSILPEPTAPAHSGELFAFIEKVHGRGPTSQALKEITDGAKKVVRNMTQPPWIQPRSQWGIAEIEALERGLEVKLLITTASREDEQRWRPALEAGAEVRVAKAIPLKLIVGDDGPAMTSLRDPNTGEQGLSNVLIRHPDIVRSLVLLFEQEWARAKPQKR
jgi:sugar-specific transcriptional regulator TrmB